MRPCGNHQQSRLVCRRSDTCPLVRSPTRPLFSPLAANQGNCDTQQPARDTPGPSTIGFGAPFAIVAPARERRPQHSAGPRSSQPSLAEGAR